MKQWPVGCPAGESGARIRLDLLTPAGSFHQPRGSLVPSPTALKEGGLVVLRQGDQAGPEIHPDSLSDLDPPQPSGSAFLPEEGG